jgi:hypothetical protein
MMHNFALLSRGSDLASIYFLAVGARNLRSASRPRLLRITRWPAEFDLGLR